MSKKLENYYLIDWLSFTVKKLNFKEVIEKVGLGNFDFVETEKGSYGYEKGLTLDGIINVYYSQKRSDMGVHVEVTGQGVRRLEMMNKLTPSDWVEYLRYLATFVSFSRIDIALDEFEGLIDFNDIIEKINSGYHVGRSRKFKVIASRDSYGNHTGTTIYIGSNKADAMLRIYEKNYERQEKGYEVDVKIWNRFELVIRHEKANDFVKKLTEDGYSLGGLFKGVLADLIRFVDYNEKDQNKSRWATSNWWQEFLEDIEPIQLKGKEYQPKLAKTLNWIEKSTLTSIKALTEIAKQEDIDFIKSILDTNNYNIDRFKEMLKEYNELNEQEKSKLISLFYNI